jgi:hypothetical protein
MQWQWNESVWRRVQDVTIWAIGAAALINELFVQDRPRPEAFPIIAGILGYPFARRADKKAAAEQQEQSP